MNIQKPNAKLSHIGHSACPHDCPSTCAVDVEILSDGTIGRLRGAKDNSYTDGVICAKVARYRERMMSAHRLLKPQQRNGAKGEGAWRDISWDDALDEVAENFLRVEKRHGREAIWPYFYAGTMGLVQRDSIQRLRHAKDIPINLIASAPIWRGPAMSQERARSMAQTPAKWRLRTVW